MTDFFPAAVHRYRRAGPLLALACLVAVLTCWPRSALAEDVVLERYVVQEGDTCSAIARRLFGDSRRYDLIHAHNPDMGKTPHRLVAGTVLMVPKTSGDPDARVTVAVRRVQAQAPQGEAWQAAQEGLGLYRGWRVNTLPRAAAEVTFRDTSALYLRENTLVVIFGGVVPGQAHKQGAVLERGALRSFLGDLRLRVRTKTSEATLSGGEALLAVDADDESRLSNFDGGNAALSSVVGGTVFVRKGFGSKVVRDRRPSRPKPLPKTPAFVSDGPTRFASLESRGGSLSAAWQSVAEAIAYRVELSIDEKGRNVIISTQVPADVTRFDAHFLPPGTYYARVSSVDAERFESRPSEPQALTLLGIRLREPAPQQESRFDPGDPSREPGAPRVLLGSVLNSPANALCAGPAQTPAAQVVLDRTGRQSVSCVLADGTELPPLALQVERPELTPLSPLPVLRVLDTHVLQLRSDRDVSTLRMEASGGPCVQVSQPVVTGPDHLQVSLHVPAGCAGKQRLELALAEHESGVRTPLLVRFAQVASAAPPTNTSEEGSTRPRSPAGIELPVSPRGRMPSLDLQQIEARYNGSYAGTSLGFLGSGQASSGRVARLALFAGTSLWAGRASVAMGYQRDLQAASGLSDGSRGLSVSGAYHADLCPELRLTLRMTGDFPTGEGRQDIAHPRLRPAVQGDLALGARATLSVQQSAVMSMAFDDAALWSSSYGGSYSLWGPLGVAGALSVALGEIAGEPFYGAAGQLSASLSAGAFQLSLGGHVALTDDFMRRFGRFGLSSTAAVYF